MVCNGFRTSQLVLKMFETKQTNRECLGNVSVSYPSLAAGRTSGHSCGEEEKRTCSVPKQN